MKKSLLSSIFALIVFSLSVNTSTAQEQIRVMKSHTESEATLQKPLKEKKRGKEPGIFNALSLGVGVGSTGLDFTLAMPIGKHFAIRAGIDFMPSITYTGGVDAVIDDPGTSSPLSARVDITGDLKRTSGEVLFSYYPFNKSCFYLTAGAYFGGDKFLKLTGHSDELAALSDSGIIIGDYEIPVDADGNINGGLKVKNFRPYVGLGFGRIVPRRRVGFMFELGCQFHGTPDVYTEIGTLSKLPMFGDDDFSKIVDKLTVYPVAKFRINIRLW